MWWRRRREAAEVRYAVRLRVLCKYFGQLCLVVGLLATVPGSLSLWFGDPALAYRYGIVLVALAGIGTVFARVRAPRRVQANEGMVIVALMFLVTPMIMAYPMMASGLAFVDALFEAVSAVTTTGLSTLTSVEETPGTFRFARAWMQWYGGLGIVVLSLALIVEPGLWSKGLGVTETVEDDLMGGLKAYSRRILAIYAAITATGVLTLWLLDATAGDAVLYTMAAVSTGGFSPHDDSLAGIGSWPIQAVVIVICFSCSIPLVLYHRLYRRRFRYDSNSTEMVALCACGLIASLCIIGWNLILSGGVEWRDTLRTTSLLAFSAQTTAGFSNTDVSTLDAFSKLLLSFVMAIGGCTGSTAGGFKILRLVVVIRLLAFMLVRASATPRAVLTPRLAGQRLEDKEIHQALLIIVLFVSVILFSWLPFVASGYDPIDSLFEVVSATGTVGLSTGITETELPTLLKVVLCVDMWLGRLEILAWLVFLHPRTWIGRRMEER